MPLMDANLDRSARRRWLKATAAAAVCIATGSAVSQPAWPAKPIRLVDGDHEISCKMDGFAIGLKACFVKKVTA